MTIKEEAERHKAEGVKWWYCPECGYQITIMEYLAAREDFPCRCGGFLSRYFPKMLAESHSAGGE